MSTSALIVLALLLIISVVIVIIVGSVAKVIKIPNSLLEILVNTQHHIAKPINSDEHIQKLTLLLQKAEAQILNFQKNNEEYQHQVDTALAKHFDIEFSLYAVIICCAIIILIMTYAARWWVSVHQIELKQYAAYAKKYATDLDVRCQKLVKQNQNHSLTFALQIESDVTRLKNRILSTFDELAKLANQQNQQHDNLASNLKSYQTEMIFKFGESNIELVNSFSDTIANLVSNCSDLNAEFLTIILTFLITFIEKFDSVMSFCSSELTAILSTTLNTFSQGLEHSFILKQDGTSFYITNHQQQQLSNDLQKSVEAYSETKLSYNEIVDECGQLRAILKEWSDQQEQMLKMQSEHLQKCKSLEFSVLINKSLE